jgi:tetratricopeptide (TPR) repeat protein
MGLVEQAVESLRSAAEEPSLRARAFELIGRCCMDQGRFEDAAVEFRAALDQQGLAPDAVISVHFELGIALEAAGRLDEALSEFEMIYGVQPSFPDVAMKIRVLRKTLETE